MSYLFKIESETDERVLSSMMDKLLQCLFKGFERGPRTFEEILRVIDKDWEKKRLDIVKRRLKDKVCILCGKSNPKGEFPCTGRSFDLQGTKYKFYYLLCWGCNFKYGKNAYYAMFSLEDVEDINIRNFLEH